MASTAQFIYEMLTIGPDALDSAGNLFRAVDNEIIDDAIAAIDIANGILNTAQGGQGNQNPLRGLKAFIKSDPIAREWTWFKRILVDMFLIIILSIGTLLVLYFLS